VKSGFFAGADIITFFAPASRCFDAPSRVRNMPVDSTTTSISKLFHGNFEGFTWEKNLINLPLISTPSSLVLISPSNLP